MRYHQWKLWLFVGLFCCIPIVCHGVNNKICLAVYVLPEATIDMGCLRSFLPMSDAVCICVPGKNEIPCLETFLQRQHLVGKVWCAPNQEDADLWWVDTIKKFVSFVKQEEEEWYVLPIFSSTKLVWFGDFSKKDLHEDVYSVLIQNKELQYRSNMLFKANLPWDSRCFFAGYQGRPVEAVSGITISSFPEQVKKLCDVLVKRPFSYTEDEYFQIMGVLGLYTNRGYKELIALFENDDVDIRRSEDRWLIPYIVGRAYAHLGLNEKAVIFLQKAEKICQNRPEIYCRLSEYFINNHQYKEAFFYAKKSKEVICLKGNYFYIEKICHEYLPDQLEVLSAYYCGEKKEGARAVDRLWFSESVPLQIQDFALANMYWYIDQLPCDMCRIIPCVLPPLRKGLSGTFVGLNPTIQKTEDGYVCIVRSANFFNNHGTYVVLDPRACRETKNILLHLDKNFSIQSQYPIEEFLERKRYDLVPIKGLEDCRLIFTGDSAAPIQFTCTTLDTNPNGVGQISFCSLTKESEKYAVTQLTPLKGPDLLRCEKNWLPFVMRGNLYAIYSFDPLLIYQIDREAGDCKTYLQIEQKYDFTHFRGSASPIAFDDGYLCMVHEVVPINSSLLKYVHRFVYLNKNFCIKKISSPFSFCDKCIEFCCGMTLDHTEKNLVMTFGIEDQEPYLGVIGVEEVRRWLYPIEEILINKERL